MSGWILIHRRAWESNGFPKEPFSEREAWFWLIANAAWKPTEINVNGDVVSLHRGQFATTTRSMATVFRWSQAKAARFTKRLTKEGRIESRTDSRKTFITICKYEEYQEPRRGAESPSDSPETRLGDSPTDSIKKEDINNTLSSLRSYSDAGASSDDPKDILFTKVLDWLNGHGRTEAHCRSMIGRWLKTHPPPDVLAACREAQANKPAEPIAYITKVLTDGQADKTEFRSSDRIVAEVLARRERRAVEQGVLPGAASDDVVVLPAVLRG